MVTKANSVERVVKVEMAADWVGMKRNEDNVP